VADSRVRAAGGVVWRRTARGNVEVLLVHRPGEGYDDWTFPKGKKDSFDETDEECALREVYEETGYLCQIGHEIARVSYLDRKDRDKRVRYWSMTILGGHEELSNEVDEVKWVALDKLGAKLTYERDERVVNAFHAYLESGLADHL